MKMLVHDDGEAVVRWRGNVMTCFFSQDGDAEIPQKLKEEFVDTLRWSYGDVEVKEIVERTHLA